jgi:protein O-GlcNAc transferase
MPTVAEVLAEGLAHHRAGRWSEARRIYRRVLAFDGDQADALHLLGALELESGPLDLAEALLAKAVAVAPLNDAAQLNLGQALQRRGDIAGTVRATRCALTSAPAGSAAWIQLGVLGGAGVCLRRALALEPQSVDALNQYAISIYRLGEADVAERMLRKAIALQPEGDGLWQNLGLIRRGSNRFTGSIRSLLRAMALRPADAELLDAISQSYHHAGDAERAFAAIRAAAALAPERHDLLASQILTMNLIDGVSAQAILAAQREWDVRFARWYTGSAAVTDRDENRRLRIGYVAVKGFAAHTAAVTLLPLLTAHDRAQVEVFCYSDAGSDQDPVAARFRELGDHWRDTRALDDGQFADLVRRDRIDVVADVYGYPQGSRLRALGRRPAPVQVNLLPMGSFGMDAVPWMIGDDRLTPEGSESWFCETIIRVPLAFCYWPLGDLPRLPPGPALRGHPIRFASFNQPVKASDRCLRLWGRILAAVPGASLVLKGMAFADDEARSALLARAAGCGLDPSRIEALAWIGDGKTHLSAYGDVDIALDPTPYGGVITTCEALSLGVPVVTLAGDRLLGRYGATLLDAVGLNDLVADSEEAYVAAAVALARDTSRLAGLRSSLPGRFAGSPICDARAYARSIEKAYRLMWQSWCRSA